jgi:3-hydroxypropanoate dehydrogenase
VRSSLEAVGMRVAPAASFGCKHEFFPEGHVKSNVCNLGYGDPGKVHPRLPRLAFDEAYSVL